MTRVITLANGITLTLTSATPIAVSVHTAEAAPPSPFHTWLNHLGNAPILGGQT